MLEFLEKKPNENLLSFHLYSEITTSVVDVVAEVGERVLQTPLF